MRELEYQECRRLNNTEAMATTLKQYVDVLRAMGKTEEASMIELLGVFEKGTTDTIFNQQSQGAGSNRQMRRQLAKQQRRK